MSEQAPAPGKGNYELQQEFLASEQARISAELFEKGVASRLVAALKHRSGAQFDVEGIAQLDNQFLPSLGMINDRGRRERQLSMVTVSTNPHDQSRAYSYFRLGRIDDANILFPYPDVPADDAEVVLQAALELDRLRSDGILPNLSLNLLSVDNLNTAMTLAAPPEADNQ